MSKTQTSLIKVQKGLLFARKQEVQSLHVNAEGHIQIKFYLT